MQNGVKTPKLPNCFNNQRLFGFLTNASLKLYNNTSTHAKSLLGNKFIITVVALYLCRLNKQIKLSLKHYLLMVVFLGLCNFAAYAQQGDKSHKLKQYTIEDYIQEFAPFATKEMRRTGIPASIKLAQGILESNFGNSNLAREANNHFGIKCHANYQGKGYYMNDDAANECFRVYDKAIDSWHDHSEFLRTRPRYAHLFKLDPKDYKAWAKGLKDAGYATNPQYANLLIRIIEERKLHQYDTANPELSKSLETKEDVVKALDNKVYIFNGLKTVIAQKYQSIDEISENMRVSLDKLLSFNDLTIEDTGFYLIPGSKVFLQKKKTKGFSVRHKVLENETMHSISQKEGIRLSNFYTLNRMVSGEEPSVGAVLELQKKAKKKPRLKSEKEVAALYEKIRGITEKKEDKTEIKDKPVPQLEKSEPKPEIKEDKPAPKPEIAKPEPPGKTEPSKSLYHTVQPKETLYGISMMYNVTMEEIQNWNRLKGAALSIGQELIVGYTSDKVKSIDDLKLQPSPFKPIYHAVKPKESLLSIANWYGVSTSDIKRWNNMTTDRVDFGDNLIVGYSKDGHAQVQPQPDEPLIEEEKKPAPKPEVREEIPTPKTAEKSFPKYHFVQPGETLYRISVNYNVTVEQVMQWNQLPDNNLSRGQKLIVGYQSLPATETQPAPPTPKPEPFIPEKKPEPLETKPAPSVQYHTVQPGETLYRISKDYNISVDDMMQWNGLTNNNLSTGQRLIVSKSAAAAKTEQKPSTPVKYHTVEPGETLYRISVTYSVSVEQLMEWNHLKNNNLTVGQRLIVEK